MASPIAGNESFSTVENTIGQLDRVEVADITAFNLNTQNLLVEGETRITNLVPALTGLTNATAAENTSTPLTSNTFVVSAYAGAGGATTHVLSAATLGDVIVILFAAPITSTNTLTISCAAGEQFKTGSTLSTAGVTVVQSAAGNNTLVYTPNGTAGNNLLNQFTKLYFMCTNVGEWRMAGVFNCDTNTAAGAFAFSTV